MDIFAELEKLRRPHYVCHDDDYYSCPKNAEYYDDHGKIVKECNCGANRHNETLDEIIDYLKKPVWIGLDLANKPDAGAKFTFENIEKIANRRKQSGNMEPPDLDLIPCAPGDLSLGDYVFACRWSDADWNDPWAVGYVGVIGKNYIELRQEDGSLIPKVGLRGFRHAIRITAEQGDKIIAEYLPNEGISFNESVMIDILSMP